jgi:hypothetical protein
VRAGVFKQRKDIPRRLPVQDSSESAILNNRLCFRTKVTQVGEADPVDAGRVATFPSAPDQSRHVKKERGVVRHSKGTRKTATRAVDLHRKMPFTGTVTTVNLLSRQSDQTVSE